MEAPESVLIDRLTQFRRYWGAQLGEAVTSVEGRQVLCNVMVPDALLAATGHVGTVFESLTFDSLRSSSTSIQISGLADDPLKCGFCQNLLQLHGLGDAYTRVVAATATCSIGAQALLIKSKELGLPSTLIDVPYVPFGEANEAAIDYLVAQLGHVLQMLGGSVDTLQDILSIERQVEERVREVWQLLVKRPALAHAIPAEYDMLIYSRTARREIIPILDSFMTALEQLEVQRRKHTWVGLHPYHKPSFDAFIVNELDAALIPMEYRPWWPLPKADPLRYLAQRILSHPEHGDVRHLWHSCQAALEEVGSSVLVAIFFDECSISRSSEPLLITLCQEDSTRLLPLHINCLSSTDEALARCRIKLQTLASMDPGFQCE